MSQPERPESLLNFSILIVSIGFNVEFPAFIRKIEKVPPPPLINFYIWQTFSIFFVILCEHWSQSNFFIYLATAVKISSPKTSRLDDTNFESLANKNYFVSNSDFPVSVEGEFDENRATTGYSYVNDHQPTVFTQLHNSQGNSWRNQEVLGNHQLLLDPNERVLRRPASCSVFPYGLNKTPGVDHNAAGVSGWLSPRPLCKELPRSSQQLSPDTWQPPREYYEKLCTKTTPFSFPPNQKGYSSSRETDIHWIGDRTLI